jgi:hypothetical protein
MSNWKTLILVQTVAAMALFSACSDLPSHSNTAHRYRARTLISKANWMKVLPGAMSDEFCESDSDIMQCYSLSHEDCRQNVSAITTQCEQNYANEIPSHMATADTATWGGTIGNCTKDGMLQLIQSKNMTPASDACRASVENM